MLTGKPASSPAVPPTPPTPLTAPTTEELLTKLKTYMEQFTTSLQIVEKCRAAGIKGRRMSLEHCPLAELIRRDLGIDNIVVGRLMLGFQELRISTNDAVFAFTTEVDQRLYPDLLLAED